MGRRSNEDAATRIESWFRDAPMTCDARRRWLARPPAWEASLYDPTVPPCRLGPVIDPEEPTEFELDGVRYDSVQTYYLALKFETAAERAQVVATRRHARALMAAFLAEPDARRAELTAFRRGPEVRALHRSSSSFRENGVTIEVGGVEHAMLCVRALVAARNQNPTPITARLRATGRARLFHPALDWRNVLAQVGPIFWMLERARV